MRHEGPRQRGYRRKMGNPVRVLSRWCLNQGRRGVANAVLGVQRLPGDVSGLRDRLPDFAFEPRHPGRRHPS